MNILIIEDCPIMSLVWKHQAKDTAHTLKFVQFKDEALELLRNNNYDLIILDNNLHGELGTEIAKEIKGITKTKIILSSADEVVGNEFIDDVIGKRQLNLKDL